MVPDDTLYTNDWVVANRITKSIGAYCSEKLGLPEGEPYNLYKKHGTCLRGLEKEGVKHDRGRTAALLSRGCVFTLRRCVAEDFLRAVHDISLSDVIKPDPALRSMLASIDTDACDPWIFTASVAAHAERCLECLGVGDVETLRGKPIIDVRAVGYLTKYEEGAYRAAERIAGEHDPRLLSLGIVFTPMARCCRRGGPELLRAGGRLLVQHESCQGGGLDDGAVRPHVPRRR